jgi:hypothetical protein
MKPRDEHLREESFEHSDDFYGGDPFPLRVTLDIVVFVLIVGTLCVAAWRWLW